MAASSTLAVIGDWHIASPIGPMLSLAVGAALIVVGAALIARAVRSATWQRAVWQTAVAAMLLLVLLEASGVGAATRILALKFAGCSGAGDSASVALAGQYANPLGFESEMMLQPGAPPATGVQAAPAASAMPSGSFPASESSAVVSYQRASPAVPRPAGVKQAAVDGSETAPPVRPPTDAAAVVWQENTVAAPGSFELLRLSADAGGAQRAAAARVASASAELLLESHRGVAFGMQDQASLWLLLAWAAGATVVLARLCWAWLGVVLFCRRCQPLEDQRLAQAAQRIAAALGLRRRVVLKLTPRLTAPVACGLLRPQVVMPEQFAADFSPQQQEAILAHELAHLASADPLWQMLAAVCCAAMWWHPLVWWAKRRLSAACETAADEASLLLPHGPDLLAFCLVAIGRRLAECRPVGSLSARGVAFRSALGRRVERLLKLPPTTGQVAWPRGSRGAMAFGKVALPIVFVILALLCTGWVEPQVPVSEGGSTMSVMAMSWRCSLMAAALWGAFGLSGNCGLVEEPAADQSAGALVMADDQGPEARDERPTASRHADGPREDRRPEGDRPGPPGQKRRAEAERPKDRPPEGGREREGDRPEREVRERETPRERADREAREREHPDRPPAEAREGQRRDGPPEFVQRRHELEAKAREIRQRLKQLGESQEAEARQLREALERIMRELRPPVPDPAEREGRVDRQRLEQHIGQLERRLAEAREARRADEVERLERELDRATQALRAGPPGGPRPVPPEVARRLAHLHVAIENLRAAGLPELAEQLARMAERLRAGEPFPRPEPRPMPPREGGPDQELFRAVRELDGQLEQMRREMQEIRENLRKLMEKK